MIRNVITIAVHYVDMNAFRVLKNSARVVMSSELNAVVIINTLLRPVTDVLE